MATTLFLSFTLTLLFALFIPETLSTCGYESCNKEKPGMINVHVVPHTHNDVGWIMTVDQYYYQSVQFILDSVVRELEEDPNKRFIYVEVAFFSRWYDEQTDAMRHRVKRLVDEGRLEFILGGWSMNDEAAIHYSAIIDNHKIGFEYLRKTFGKCGTPKIGWQIDPFGHSREQASIFARFGFDGLFFGRLDYQDKESRIENATMEMVWRASRDDIGKSANLFTGVLPNGYSPPKGFCFDIRCQDIDPKIHDNPNLHDYNVQQEVDRFIKEMETQASWYNSNHLITTMGEDFNYVTAPMWFKELDKLIKYVNARQAKGSKVNLLYSTPSCYLKTVNNDFKTWTVKDDDFFPYADRAHTFWTGYFTSRPAFKYYARYVNSFYQAVKQMDAIAKLDNSHESRKYLHRTAEVLGVAQHHDAISGTAKQAVDYDYAQRLAEGLADTEMVLEDAIHKLTYKDQDTPLQIQKFCHYLNISVCEATQQTNQCPQTAVKLYNPLTWSVNHIVRLPVSGSSYTVTAPDGFTQIPFDLMPVAQRTQEIVGPSMSPAKSELVFKATVPPVGFSSYLVKEIKEDISLRFTSEKKSKLLGGLGASLSGKYIQVDFTADGELKSITNKNSGHQYKITQEYRYYTGFEGNNTTPKRQASGAYIFRPVNSTSQVIGYSTWSGTRKGQVVQEAYQTFGDYVSQVIRVFEDKPYVEVEWTVGPIPIEDHKGKEVVTRYNLEGFDNENTFFTDSNGREILERRLNYRPTWNLRQTEPVAGNYYPVNALLAIKDESKGVQFTVLTDRSQGGTSLNKGDVELMVHRRLLVDDGKGVGEALNETGTSGAGLVVRGKHYLLLSPIQEAAHHYRTIAKEVFYTPPISFSCITFDPKTWIKVFNTNWTGLAQSLPPNVHLLTLEQFQHNGPVPSRNGSVPYLLRFEHFFQAGEDKSLSRAVTFDIKGLFKPFALSDVHELTLGANMPIEASQRLHWRTMDNPKGDINLKRHLNGTTVSLGPMDIVTLQANIKM